MERFYRDVTHNRNWDVSVPTRESGHNNRVTAISPIIPPSSQRRIAAITQD